MAQTSFQREQRQRYLLRLVCAKFSRLFLASPNTLSRVVVDGIDAFLTKLFWGVYEDLNREVRFIFEELSACEDKNLWNEIFIHRYRYHIAITVLMRMLLYFETFKRSKSAFITRVNSAERLIQFNDQKFNVLFAALFSDLFVRLDDKGWAREIDVLFGDGTSRKVEKISQEFSPSR